MGDSVSLVVCLAEDWALGAAQYQTTREGRKRHLLVDTQGLVLKAKAHTANVMDRDGVILLLPPEQTKEQFPRVSHVWLDAGYNGKDKGKHGIEP